MFDGFVNPALAIGATLAAVPLLIHLLNRQRHKPLAWGAMRFVIEAYKKTRRRAQIENLILLLLRMAAVALLAFAVARPFTGAHSMLSVLTQSRRDVVLVLDGSASTGYRQDVRSVFENIVARAREIALQLDGARDDRLAVILAGARPRLLAWRRPDEALSVLATLTTPTDEPLDLAAAFGEVARLAQEDTARGAGQPLELRLLTDLQRRSFQPETALADTVLVGKGATPGASGAQTGAQSNALFEQLDQLKKLGLTVLVEDLGTSEVTPPNAAITAVEPIGPVLGAQTTVDIAVVVHNFGATAKTGLRVSLVIDNDQKLPYRPLDIAARGEARAVFPVVFKSSGDHVVAARIESDRLSIDDERITVLAVPPAARVLLVDGESAPETEQDEVGYLSAVLAPSRADGAGEGDAIAPFLPRVVEPFALRDEALDFDAFDLIWLANVENLPDVVIQKLERRVAAGAGLVISAGKKLEPSNWNSRLFRADGSGLLPAELGTRVSIGRREGYFRVRDFATDHPAFAFFADEHWKPLLTEVPIYEFLTSHPLADARVLAKLDDDAASPLLIERSYDRGKVFLWTTSIDPEWTRLPESPRTLVPLIHEWVRYAARPATPARNLAIGAALIAEVNAFPRSPSLVLPDGSRRALENAPATAGPGTWRISALGATDRVGQYKLELEGASALPFAVQFDARESDLERLAPNELAGLHPALSAVGRDDGPHKNDDDQPARQGELWRPLAIACFVALALETLWAAWIGRSRRIS
jgi:hypothetical protein